MDKQMKRRILTLHQAADVLRSLANEGMTEAQHGTHVGIDHYLRKVATKLEEKYKWLNSP